MANANFVVTVKIKGVNFPLLVAKMRRAQKAYFKDRKQSNLIEAKKIEAEVDKALKDRLTFKLSEDSQPRLTATPDEKDDEA